METLVLVQAKVNQHYYERVFLKEKWFSPSSEQNSSTHNTLSEAVIDPETHHSTWAPSYSSDLAQCDFFFFPKYAFMLTHFESVLKVGKKWQRFEDDSQKKSYCTALNIKRMQKLKNRYKKILAASASQFNNYNLFKMFIAFFWNNMNVESKRNLVDAS